jgi:hypothetical protein
VADLVQSSGEVGERLPGHRIFEITPAPLDRLELWTIRWPRDTADMFRPAESRRRVGAAVLSQQEIQALGEGLGERLAEELAHVRMPIGEFQKDARAGGRSHSPIDIEPCEDVWDSAHGLKAAGR